MNVKLKQYLEFLPIVSLGALGIGYYYIYVFYSRINIDIFSFISTSEIFLAFVPHLPFILVIALATTLAFGFSYAIEDHFDNLIKKFNSKLMKVILHLLTFIIIMAIGSVYIYLPTMKNTNIQILVAIIFIAIVLISIYSNKGIKSNFIVKKIDLYIIIVYLFIVSRFNAVNMSNEVLNNKSIEFKINTLQNSFSNEDFIYYGRIKEYTFLIGKEDSIVDIVKNSLIISEQFKKPSIP